MEGYASLVKMLWNYKNSCWVCALVLGSVVVIRSKWDLGMLYVLKREDTVGKESGQNKHYSLGCRRLVVKL